MEGSVLKTILTAVVSAVVGGLIAALVILFGISGLDAGPGDVTISEAEAPASETGNAQRGFDERPSSASVQDIYTRDGPGVVSVDVRSSQGPGGGSGFVIDGNGYVVTNQHVVEGAEAISVRFASGTRAEAEIVGEDPSTDISVLRVQAPQELLKPLTLGDSDSVEVGDPVIAIGNPLNVGVSVTTGIISGLDRPIRAPNNYTISGAVQTDAAINPGNSGGPLLDSQGTVIGVNSQIISETGAFQGVGFAVPINTVKSVVQQLITTGEAQHGYMGVSMFDLGVDEIAVYAGLPKEQLAQGYGLPEQGAIVSETVPDGPADRAGIRGGEVVDIESLPIPLGDVITNVNEEPVSSPDDVIEVVNSLQPGDTIALTVVTPREDPREVEVRLEEQPESQSLSPLD